MRQRAIMIGLPQTCRLLEKQLELLQERPEVVGWVHPGPLGEASASADPILGSLDDLEMLVESHRPSLALVTLPAAMGDLTRSVRTRLRKLGVPDRFMPTLADQLQGIGPRAHLEVDLGELLDRPSRPINEAAVRGVLAHRRVLITGAGGSIGGELARLVVRYELKSLVLVDRSENALFEIDRQIARLAPDLARHALLHDVVDQDGTDRIFFEHRPQVVFHAAAHKHVPMMEDHPGAAVDNNLFGTKSAADAADAFDVERFVMISSDKAVNPRSIMGATKRLAELYVQNMNRRSSTLFSMVRFGNVLGSSGSVLDIWSRQLAEGGPLTVTDPEMTRFFMTIPEAAALVVQTAALLDPDAPGAEVFLLDMGEPVRILDLARRFVALHGLAAVLPDEQGGTGPPGGVRIVYTGIRPGEKLHEELAFDAEALRPTRHPDINIWMIEPPDDRYIEQIQESLAPRRRPRSPRAVAETVRRLIPEMVRPAMV